MRFAVSVSASASSAVLLLLHLASSATASPVNSYPVAPQSSSSSTTPSRASTSTAPLPSPADGIRATILLGELKERTPEPEPTDCTNNGSGNTGCNNSGINNSGTNNSGIGNSGTNNSGIDNCGTNHSGVGEGCNGNGNGNGGTVVTAAPDSTPTGGSAYTTVLSGPTSTVTVVIDGNHRRSDCAYWQAQGFVCSGAVASVPRQAWAAVVVAVGAGALLVL